MRSDKVTLDRMPDLEMCFEIDVNVYTLYEDETVRPCHKSRELFSRKNKTRKVMNLNLYEDHLSYISKLNTHCKKFECILCGRLFGSSTNQSKHT